VEGSIRVARSSGQQRGRHFHARNGAFQSHAEFIQINRCTPFLSTTASANHSHVQSSFPAFCSRIVLRRPSRVRLSRIAPCTSMSQFFRYNRIDLFAPAGVSYVNGSTRQVPFFSLAPVSFKSPEAFVPNDPSKMNFRNVQALVEAINSGSSPMPKSSTLVADGLTLIAEAELKALSLLANMWPSRNFSSRVTSLERASPSVMQQLSSASVFAVAVSSAVAFEFPGQKLDGMASSTSDATQFSPAFAASLSNLNALSLTWSAASSSVVASVPLPFPSPQISQLPVRRFVNPFLHVFFV
jgi:hypothetical protein